MVSTKTKASIATGILAGAAITGSFIVKGQDTEKTLAVAGILLSYIPGSTAVGWLLRDDGFISNKLLRKRD
jgi:hypothetical protein